MPRSIAEVSASRPTDFVAVANGLFHKFHIPLIRRLSDCDPSAFVTLYEGILGDRLKGVISRPVTREDEIHNVQCVVDSLASEVLHCDLSHITGRAVVEGNVDTIQYLLEILDGLVDYVMEQISSETSSDVDEFKPLQEVSRSMVSLDEDFRRTSRTSNRGRNGPGMRTPDSVSLPSTISLHPDADAHSVESDSTTELIKLGEESASYRGRHRSPPYKSYQPAKNHANDNNFDKAGPSQTLDSMELSMGPLSQLTPTNLHSGTKPRQRHSTQVTGKHQTPDGMELSMGPLSQLTPTTLHSGSKPRQQKISSSFSSASWPKAPGSDSFHSLDSIPATLSNLQQTSHTEAFSTERMSPYGGLLGSLLGDMSDLSSIVGQRERAQDKKRTPIPSSTVTTTGGRPAAAATQQTSHRRSPRFTSQPATVSGSRPTARQAADPLDTYQQDARSSSKKYQGSTRRKSPRLTPARTPTSTQKPTTSATHYRDAFGLGHSPPTREKTKVSAATDETTFPARLPQYSPHQRQHPVATSTTYPAALPQGQSLSRLSQKSNKEFHPRQHATATMSDTETFPATLPPHVAATTGTSYPDSYSYHAAFRQHEPLERQGEAEDSSVLLPDIRSRLRGARSKSPERGVQGLRREGREERGNSSLLTGSMEDSYDRSFMRRKVAQRRRVAFEDEINGTLVRDGDENQHPSRRFRPSRESEEEEDASDVLYGRHGDPLREYGRRDGEDEEESRRDLEEKEAEEESHSYVLRPRKKASSKGAGKRKAAKAPTQRSVLLLRSIPQRREPPPKNQFEDALHRDARGLLGKVRRRLAEEAGEQAKLKAVLRYSYAGNLRDVKQGVKQQVQRRKKVTKQMDSEYKAIHGQPKTSKYVPAKKYTIPMATTSPKGSKASRRPTARTSKRSPPSSKRKRAASTSPTSLMQGGERPLRIGDDDLLPTLMQEFPFLQVSPHTAQRMWAQQSRQMDHLTRTALEQRYKKPKTQAKIEEAEKKQEILVGIMKKELAHNQRLREIKERRNQERAMRTKAQEQRQVNARARRYYDEFHTRSKSRALKRRTREEQIFKHLFEEGMAIQKARVSELRKYAREKREEYTKRQKDEVESLENHYRDQFNMLGEMIAKERQDLQITDKEQKNAMQRLKAEMRHRMESEIRDYQEQLHRDEDADYFRQLEADRMRHELTMAKYKAQL